MCLIHRLWEERSAPGRQGRRSNNAQALTLYTNIFGQPSCWIASSYWYDRKLIQKVSACKMLLLLIFELHFQSADWKVMIFCSVSSVAQSCPTLCDPMDCSTPGFPVHDQLLELAQTHVQRVSDALQPSHPLSSPSPPAPNPFKCQGLFQWISYSHQMAKVLELQLQHQSFQWIFRTDFL